MRILLLVISLVTIPLAEAAAGDSAPGIIVPISESHKYGISVITKDEGNDIRVQIAVGEKFPCAIKNMTLAVDKPQQHILTVELGRKEFVVSRDYLKDLRVVLYCEDKQRKPSAYMLYFGGN